MRSSDVESKKPLDNAPMNRNVFYALLAAALFGASTPFAKLLVANVSPVMLAGLLYLGSGIGLALIRLIRDKGWKSPHLAVSEWPWLLGAIFSGGVLGPVALLVGLGHTTGSTASLLLNLEAVLTAVIAWVVFRESADKRIVFGMVAIVLGGLTLSWHADGDTRSNWLGPVLISLACLCWAIDNNLTRKVSASDALFIAGFKGLIAGAVNCGFALFMGLSFPNGLLAISTMTLGLMGYGVSLVLFVLALRGLGTARTGAYFSTAPFIGAAISVVLIGESTGGLFWLAAAMMAIGVWLHLTEHHEHDHHHELLDHEHNHTHDAHHQHIHDFAWDGGDPHAHRHVHAEVTHKHPHYPDIHHRHTH
jgi:drug/metabolite transporter (DMT)-like permease